VGKKKGKYPEIANAAREMYHKGKGGIGERRKKK